jgi:hypothetical protein
MPDNNKGLVAAGASLVWRHQRILWWVFAVNLVIGLLGAASARAQLDKLLKYSLAGESLTKGFDLGMFFELVSRPEANLMRSTGSSYLFAALFPIFMLFAIGGILAVYRDDREYDTGEFFAASGLFFWRFVRLTLLSLVPFGILAAMFMGVNKGSSYIGDRAVSAQTGFYILVAGCVLVLLLTLFVRLWFDVAQVRMVVQNDRRVWRNLWRSLGISGRKVLTLFRVYLCISGVAWVTLAVGLFVWSKLPPTATRVSFILLEFIILMQLATRLWQRASAVTWYKRHAAIAPADVVDFTTAAPVELAETAEGTSPAADANEPEGRNEV